ncbi:MAG TPA: trypsin-like peptidase domain-containing protein [Spirochaetales bacterium]|nr:trypsin-like peptidase domain-containing protein [Spirochaetales bacterium]HRY53341.1 trypsin-like peptidase domain-containing protein [Spirochaetia bacterium]HRZ66143.1 trypsin-like peptidase domain-containing protein [Spirochaetia bacterium]
MRISRRPPSSIRGRNLLLAAAILSLGACGGLPKPPKDAAGKLGPSYGSMKLEELSALSTEEPEAFLEAFAAISRSPRAAGATAGPGDPAALEPLAGAASAKIYAAYREALGAKDYPRARASIESLTALAADAFTAKTLAPEAAEAASRGRSIVAELHAAEAEDYFARKLSTPAFLAYRQALREGRAEGPGFDPRELGIWASRALAAKDRSALKAFGEAAKAAGIPLPEGAEGFSSSRDSVSLMSKGVVTVRVDRGMKIQQGVGVPDRVLGSAFFVDPAGYLLTNYHVIESEVDPGYEGYSRLSIRIAEDPEARIAAKVVGWDRILDLALIKVDLKPAYVFSLADDEKLAPGDKILAIGSPVGLESTVTSGIVSAVGRKLFQAGQAVQVDAALNPGNSGGPLIDEEGRAVGIVFAGLNQYQNLNFAISSAWALRVLPELFRGGELKRAWLGLSLAESHGGLEVVYRHPRAAEGIEGGDRLLALGGEPIKEIPEAQALMAGRSPGSLVSLRLAGPGAGEGERILLRRLGERPFSPIEDAFGLDRRDRLLAPLFGMEAARQPGSFLEPDSYSVVRVWPGTIADEAGLSANDPFALRRFFLDEESRAAVIQIRVKKRKAGFLESILQIPAPLEVSAFL